MQMYIGADSIAFPPVTPLELQGARTRFFRSLAASPALHRHGGRPHQAALERAVRCVAIMCRQLTQRVSYFEEPSLCHNCGKPGHLGTRA